LARVAKGKRKPLALLDSNVIVYSMIIDYPNRESYVRCRNLLERGLRGELDHILSLNPIVVVEVFAALRRLLNWSEAEFRIGSLLRSRRIAFLSISREAAENSVRWAKEKGIPINDAMIGANMVEFANLVYTTDEKHFEKLEEYGVRFINPLKL
jgi:predicted nucleic acid-binding protein